MLYLKKLEEKLDKALANETSESLTNWLQEKRLRIFRQSLGEGTFEDLSQIYNSNRVRISDSISFEVEYCDVSFGQEYLIAA